MGAKAGTNQALQQQGAQQAPAESAPAPAPAPAPPPAPAAGGDTISQLTQLAELHGAGALTDEEFAAAKAQVLGT
jgi:hypothetical protein